MCCREIYISGIMLLIILLTQQPSHAEDLTEPQEEEGFSFASIGISLGMGLGIAGEFFDKDVNSSTSSFERDWFSLDSGLRSDISVNIPLETGFVLAPRIGITIGDFEYKQLPNETIERSFSSLALGLGARTGQVGSGLYLEGAIQLTFILGDQLKLSDSSNPLDSFQISTSHTVGFGAYMEMGYDFLLQESIVLAFGAFITGIAVAKTEEVYSFADGSPNQIRKYDTGNFPSETLRFHRRYDGHSSIGIKVSIHFVI